MSENKINVTFSTNVGDVEDDFPENQPLHSLKIKVMTEVKLDPSQSENFIVTYNGIILDENKSLKELEIPEGAILVIERKEIVKI